MHNVIKWPIITRYRVCICHGSRGASGGVFPLFRASHHRSHAVFERVSPVMVAVVVMMVVMVTMGATVAAGAAAASWRGLLAALCVWAVCWPRWSGVDY